MGEVEMQQKRRQIMVDQQVQGLLIGRAIRYWFLCLAMTAVSCWFWETWRTPSVDGTMRIWDIFVPAALTSLLLLPAVIRDVLRVSNQFVGPIHELRNGLKQLLLGDRVAPLRVRPTDCWADVIERFNRLIEHMETGRARQLPLDTDDERPLIAERTRRD